MKILIVEDDSRIATPLAKDLRHQNHTVDIAVDGIEGWNFAQAADYDLILLDWMLPRLDGVELCKRLRAEKSQVMILMLTAKDTANDMVLGLDAGADDYLVKPFKLDVLSARIRALNRRNREVVPTVLNYGPLTLDPSSRTIKYQDNPLKLTPKEYVILEYFLHHPKQVITRDALLNQLWEFNQISGEGTVKTHMGNLRSKLKAAGSPANLIATVYGVGYRFVLPKEERQG